jgi:hypothetical protein
VGQFIARNSEKIGEVISRFYFTEVPHDISPKKGERVATHYAG